MTEIDKLIQDLQDVNAVKVEYDADGNPFVTQGGETLKDFSDQKAQVDELQGVIGGFDSLSAPQWDDGSGNSFADQYGQYQQGFDEALAGIQGSRDADVADSRQYAAEMLGYNNWDEYSNDVSGMRQDVNAGIDGQQGFSADEAAKYKEFQQRQMNDMRDDLQRQAESVMASTGSTMGYLQAADDARKQMSNERLKGELAFMQQDFERKTVQFEAKKDQLWSQVQAGTMTAEQFLDNIREDRMATLQGYASGMSQVMDQYGGQLAGYQSELQGLSTHADLIYKSIMTDLGVDQAAIDYANAMYDSQVSPLVDQLTALVTAEQLEIDREMLEETKHQNDKNWWDNFWGE